MFPVLPIQDPESLLDDGQPLFNMALTSLYSVETQRAGLHFLLAMCEKVELSRAVLLRILNALLQSMSDSYVVDYEKTSNLLLLNKVCGSRSAFYTVNSL